MERKIIIAITGASGSIYAKRLLEKIDGLNNQIAHCAVIFSSNARDIWHHEIGEMPKLPDGKFSRFEKNDFNAPFASGSSRYDTMIIVPCSMGVAGRIASGISDDLITRAADVSLKERRTLIMVVRETPYNLIHLKNMTRLTKAGAIIVPATPSFYSHPDTIEALVDTVINRILDLAGFENEGYRWKENH